MTDDLVKTVFDRGEGEIPGATVIDLVAAEGFFELCEAVPGVFGIFGGCDAPEIEGFLTVIFGVEDHLDKDGDASVDFAILIAGGGMSVKTSSDIVVDEGSGEGDFGRVDRCFSVGCFGVCRVFWGEFGNIEGGEAGFQLVFEVGFCLGLEIVFFADGLEQGSEGEDFFWVFRLADLKAFFGATTPILDAGGAHLFQNIFARLSKVNYPSMSGVEVMGFIEVEGFGGRGREGEGGFDADEKSVSFVGEGGKGTKSEFKGVFWIFGSFKGWSVGAIEVVTEGGGVEDGKGREVFFFEAEGLVAFELFVFFPNRGLKKMLVHEHIIA